MGYSTDLWQQMAELDLIGLLLPEDHGGSAMSALEGVVLYEELGRALAPTPHFASAVLCGGALARAGSAAQQAQWLHPSPGARPFSRRRGSSPRTAVARRASRSGPSPTVTAFG